MDKFREPTLIPHLLDGNSLLLTEPGAGVTADNQFHAVRRARLTLTDFAISVANAQDYGGTKLCDLPDTNLMLLAVEVNCTVVKAGTTNGIVAATDLDIGIGTAVASASTLAAAMINVMEKADLNTDALSVTWQAHSADQATAAFPLQIADGAGSALYVNLATGNITADDSVAISGTIDILFVDLGNVAS